GKRAIAAVRHLLAGGLAERALDQLVVAIQGMNHAGDLYVISGMKPAELAETFAAALEAAFLLRRRPRDINEIRRLLLSLGAASDGKIYYRSAPAWLEALKHASGSDDWKTLEGTAEPGPRLMMALRAAQERYAAAPEEERGYRPDEAIRALSHYVVISIAV